MKNGTKLGVGRGGRGVCVFNTCGVTPCILTHSHKQIEKLSEGLTKTQDPASTPASALASAGLAAGVPAMLCLQPHQARCERASI